MLGTLRPSSTERAPQAAIEEAADGLMHRQELRAVGESRFDLPGSSLRYNGFRVQGLGFRV